MRQQLRANTRLSLCCILAFRWDWTLLLLCYDYTSSFPSARQWLIKVNYCTASQASTERFGLPDRILDHGVCSTLIFSTKQAKHPEPPPQTSWLQSLVHLSQINLSLLSFLLLAHVRVSILPTRCRLKRWIKAHLDRWRYHLLTMSLRGETT